MSRELATSQLGKDQGGAGSSFLPKHLKSGGERGIRTPGTRWVQQISSLPHSTTLPSLRGRAELRILSGADALFAAHVAAQGGRDDHRAVGLLIVLENGDERAAHGEA